MIISPEIILRFSIECALADITNADELAEKLQDEKFKRSKAYRDLTEALGYILLLGQEDMMVKYRKASRKAHLEAKKAEEEARAAGEVEES